MTTGSSGRTHSPRAPFTAWSRGRKVLFLVLVVPGLLFFVIGVPALIVHDLVQHTGRTSTAHGTTTAVSSASYKGQRGCTVRFRDPRTNADRSVHGKCSADTRVGTAIEVDYPSGHPENATLTSPTGEWVQAGVALGALVVVAVVLLVRRRRSRRGPRAPARQTGLHG